MLILRELRSTGLLAPLQRSAANGTYRSMWLMLEDSASLHGDHFQYLNGPANQLSRCWDPSLRTEQRAVFGTGYSLAAVLASWKRRPRKVFLAWSIPRSKFRRWLLARLLRRFDLIITNDRLTSQELVSQLKIEDRKILFIPYGVDTDFFCPQDVPSEQQADLIVPGDAYRDEATVEFILANTSLTILRLTNRKEIAAQYEELKKEYPNRITLEYQVTHAKLPSVYSRGRICLLPIKKSSEPAGLTCLLESMACGVPVFCNNAKTHQDYITDSETGSGYSGSQELIDRLNALDPTTISRMSANCRKFAVDSCSWAKLQPIWEQKFYLNSTRTASSAPESIPTH